MIEYLVPDMPSLAQIYPALEEIDSTRWYSNFGPLEARFRTRLADEVFGGAGISQENIATCSSGTSAISLALKALELKKGSNVLIPSFTFPGTVAAVLDAGYKPVLCDVDLDSWKLDAKQLDWYFQRMNISAIVPVATFGASINAETWSDISKSYNVPVIVDAAAALGQQDLGDLILCFSLHATKLIGAGEGGLVVAKDKCFIKRVTQLSNYGYKHGEITLLGTNSKFSEYHAAVGLAQLDRLTSLIAKRSKVYQSYLMGLENIQNRALFTVQQIQDGMVPSSFVIKLPYASAKSLWDYFRSEGIQSRQLYCPSLHEHSALQSACIWFNDQLKVSTELGCSTLALPYHNFLSEQDVIRVCHQLDQALDTVLNSNVAVN